jgi:hypothetical protein
MQVDMHYYGTYAMARTAGLDADASRIIATAAQFVDDNAGKDTIEFEDGARVDVDATAHHAADRHNLDEEDQRNVWVPFHFLPGNKGRQYTEKLLCVMDGEPARETVSSNLAAAVAKADSPGERCFALALMGVTAHVYADTFSHYGFSGVSSRRNKIEHGSIELRNASAKLKKELVSKEQRFLERYGLDASLRGNIRRSIRQKIRSALRDGKAELAESLSGGLGHGAALTYPDQPFLIWEFRYDDGRASGVRDNPATFLRGCERLHEMFARLAQARPDLSAGDGRAWSEIERPVREILQTQEPDKDRRIALWQARARGLLPGRARQIPPYDANRWHAEREALAGTSHSRAMLETEVFHFYRAAAHHRTHLLRELLPKRGLVVK